MAITQTLTQVTWPTAATTGSVTANSNLTSEVMTLDASCVAAQIQLKADNAGTPVAGDYINFYVLQSSGDPDAAETTDEYDTVGHAIFLARVDTFVTDPALVTVPFPLPQKNFKIYAEGDHADATASAITVSAQVIEQRAS
jgi:hypothetical protein